MSSRAIAVVGLWHLGEIYSAGLAELGHSVVGVSDDEGVIANFSRDIPPLPEPQLEKIIARNRSRNMLRYTTDFSEIARCNILWITFDTPVNGADEADLSPIWDALKKSLPHLAQGVLVAVSSQIPVGTSEKIIEHIRRARPELEFDYAYTPENLRLGEAVKCFMQPGRIVVGAASERASARVEEIFLPLKAEIVRMSPASAEVAKHALNAFLATSISFINDIADVCEKSGADVLDVARALRSDPRIGEKAALNAGLGFSGGTLGRDLMALAGFAKERDFTVPVIKAVLEKNTARTDAVMKKISTAFGAQRMSGKVVAVFGLTYKPGTPTLRRSRVLELAAKLSKEGAALRLHDPVARKEELPAMENAAFYADPYEAARGADMLLFATPWPEFKKLDFKKLIGAARRGAILFDAPNMFYDEARTIEALGAKYIGIGRRTEK